MTAGTANVTFRINYARAATNTVSAGMAKGLLEAFECVFECSPGT